MTTIFVAKLDFGVTEEELRDLFAQFGNVAKVNIAKDKETGKPRGFAFVEMFNEAEAQEAIKQLDGHSFNGRNCVVKQAEDRGGNQQRGGQGNFQKREGFQPREGNRGGKFEDRPKPTNQRNDDIPPLPIPLDDDDDKPSIPLPLKPTPKKKKTPTKSVNVDTTSDGKTKKPKMDAYRKSGRDQLQFDDEDLDDELDLFGRNEEDELDEDYSKYLVNSDDDDDEEEWDEDEDWEDDEEWEDDDY